MAAAGARRAYLGDSLYPGRRAGEPISLTSRRNLWVAAAADFDGNRVPDLVYQNTQSGEVNVDYYEGPGGATFKGWACLSCGISMAGWQLVGAADFDGNGVPDLVYQNTQSGEVNVDYYGGPGGKTFKGWNVLSATGNPGWSVIVPRSR